MKNFFLAILLLVTSVGCGADSSNVGILRLFDAADEARFVHENGILRAYNASGIETSSWDSATGEFTGAGGGGGTWGSITGTLASQLDLKSALDAKQDAHPNLILLSSLGTSGQVPKVNAAADGLEWGNDTGGIADPGANGILARTALNTVVSRTITGSTDITVSHGDGVSENPTITAAANLARLNTNQTWSGGQTFGNGFAVTAGNADISGGGSFTVSRPSTFSGDLAATANANGAEEIFFVRNDSTGGSAQAIMVIQAKTHSQIISKIDGVTKWQQIANATEHWWTFNGATTIQKLTANGAAVNGRLGVNTATPPTSGAYLQAPDLFLTNATAGNVVATVKGAASQTANLTNWTNSANTVLASVSSAGVFTGSGAGLTSIPDAALSANANDAITKRHAANTDTGTDSNSFTVDSGGGTDWKYLKLGPVGTIGYDAVNDQFTFNAEIASLSVGDTLVVGSDIEFYGSLYGDGTGLTNIPDSALSSNIPKLNASTNTFTGEMDIANQVRVGGNLMVGTNSASGLSNITFGTSGFTQGNIDFDPLTGADGVFSFYGAQIQAAYFNGDGSLLTSLNPANLSGPVTYTKGGTGLTTLGTAGQVPTVNAGGTAIEWATPSGGGGLTPTDSSSFTAWELMDTAGALAGNTGWQLKQTGRTIVESTNVGVVRVYANESTLPSFISLTPTIINYNAGNGSDFHWFTVNNNEKFRITSTESIATGNHITSGKVRAGGTTVGSHALVVGDDLGSLSFETGANIMVIGKSSVTGTQMRSGFAIGNSSTQNMQMIWDGQLQTASIGTWGYNAPLNFSAHAINFNTVPANKTLNFGNSTASIGFYGATAVARPYVPTSYGYETTVDQLLYALESLGLIDVGA